MYQDLLDRYAVPSAQVVDNWWFTEIGSPITARALRPPGGWWGDHGCCDGSGGGSRQGGAFASLGGSIIHGEGGLIPKTKSGKTLRRVLRELLEDGLHCEFTRQLAVPSTVDDVTVVDVARAKIKEYFDMNADKHKAVR